MTEQLPTRVLIPMMRSFREAWAAYWTLLKVMVPALLVMKTLEVLGVTTLFGHWLAPLMSPLGLPLNL
jgi:hypothetical protein